VKSKVKALRVLTLMISSYRRTPSQFEAVIPGVCSFLAKGFNMEFETKSSYLQELCVLMEIFSEIFCEQYRYEIKAWNEDSSKEA
jgi:hypothetical protein